MSGLVTPRHAEADRQKASLEESQKFIAAKRREDLVGLCQDQRFVDYILRTVDQLRFFKTSDSSSQTTMVKRETLRKFGESLLAEIYNVSPRTYTDIVLEITKKRIKTKDFEAPEV